MLQQAVSTGCFARQVRSKMQVDVFLVRCNKVFRKGSRLASGRMATRAHLMEDRAVAVSSIC